MSLPESQTGVDPVHDCGRERLGVRHTSFYERKGKRVLDVFGATLGLVVLAPLLGLVALAVKATSAGPAFFRQLRVGKNGRCFRLLKFRSMVPAADSRALCITVRGDSRVTRLGIWLRRYKVDELPQLWNVLKGDMSLVGPRPEVERYVKCYSNKEREVLRVRPGITDPASLAYRHEEAILFQHADPEEYYRSRVLHDKLALNLSYIDSISLHSDLRLVLKTLRSLFI